MSRAPKFDFDNSSLEPQDVTVLQQIAKCVTNGPLKGRSLLLTGRADPRGEVEYNFALGEHRADAVDTYLAQLGVDKKSSPKHRAASSTQPEPTMRAGSVIAAWTSVSNEFASGRDGAHAARADSRRGG